MRIVCVGYRKWAINIYLRLQTLTDHNFLIFKSQEQFDEELIKDFRPDIILFYGWSWIISDALINEYTCLMLHPSPLPKYRGGSPIQNQIINGEIKSTVTIFCMTNSLDAGDIVGQEEIDLAGNIGDVLERIENAGTRVTLEILKNKIQRIPQSHKDATYFSRRDDRDNEITMSELQSKPAQYLYNKIRMLGDPYPYAYIKTSDGKKLLIISAKIDN